MGYSIYVFDKDKRITEADFYKAFEGMNHFNREGYIGIPPVDFRIEEKYVKLSGSHGVSGNLAMPFTLDLVINLVQLGYKPLIYSDDFGFYRYIEDFQEL